MKTIEGKTIYAYRRLPYAKPPVKGLRFRKPEPSLPWQGELDCSKESKKSHQPNPLVPDVQYLSEGGEDCLYLSVFTKYFSKQQEEEEEQDSAKKLLPVVAFLHGGAFVMGSAESDLYGPQVLLDREVVLVGINYRLGALGWLSMETDSAPGNLGLWDQRLALVWIRDNIQRFGGDPCNVTLFGQSAGAMCASYHLVSPQSKGLFQKMIALSGSPTNLMLVKNRRPRVYARAMAEKLGCSKEASAEQVIEFLQKQSAANIMKTSLMFLDWDHVSPMPWTPVLDSHLQNPFIPLPFSEAVRSASVSRVPVLMGSTKDEGLILSAPFHRDNKRMELLTREWEVWAPLLFLGRDRDLVGGEEKQLVREIKEQYWPQDDMGKNHEEDLAKIKDIFSMTYFKSPLALDSSCLAKAGFPVYKLETVEPTAFSLSQIFSLKATYVFVEFFKYNAGWADWPKPQGLGHGDDLGYIFPMAPYGFPPSVITTGQQRVRNNLLDIVSSFSLSGAPSQEGTKTWEPIGGLDQDCHLEVGGDTCALRFSEGNLKTELDFWAGVKERALRAQGALLDTPPPNFYTKVAADRRH